MPQPRILPLATGEPENSLGKPTSADFWGYRNMLSCARALHQGRGQRYLVRWSIMYRSKMQSPLARITVTFLCLLGLFVQSIGGGLSGGWLCVGCERTGLTLKGPGTSQSDGCCIDEQEPCESPPLDSVPIDRPCGCVTIPLAPGFQISVGTPRFEANHDPVTLVEATIVKWISLVPPRPNERWSRADLAHPPRLLCPSARRTVLLI